MSQLMIPKERYQKILRGEKPDKLPLSFANCNHFLINYYGISVSEFLNSPEAAAKRTIQFTSEFHFDCNMAVAAEYVFYGCGPELGVKWGFPEGGFPGPLEGFIKTREDMKGFKIPSAPSGYFKRFLEIIEKVNQVIGDQVYLQASILGPFSVACFIRGVEETLLDLHENPAFYHEYMPLCVELSKYFGKHIFATGLEAPRLVEIFLVPAMVSPDQYHRNIVPYIQQVIDFFGPDRLSNTYGAFLGKPGDRKSQEEGRYLWDAFWGTKESLEALEKGIKYRPRRFPAVLTISGRALFGWGERELLDFLRKGADLIVKDYHLYPALSLISIQPDSKEKADEMAEKIRKIDEFRNQYALD